MATRIKAFDCVDMKRKAHERLRREYDAGRNDFDSYFDFLNKTAERSPLWKRLQEKTARAKAKAGSAPGSVT